MAEITLNGQQYLGAIGPRLSGMRQIKAAKKAGKDTTKLEEEKEEAIRLAREGVKQIKNASSKLVPIQGGK